MSMLYTLRLWDIPGVASVPQTWALTVEIIAFYGRWARKIISWQGNTFNEFCRTDLFYE